MKPGSAPEETRLAQPPRPPAPSRRLQLLQQEKQVYVQTQEQRESRSVLRGIVALILLALIFAGLRAGMDRAFYTGWWRQW